MQQYKNEEEKFKALLKIKTIAKCISYTYMTDGIV